MGVLQGTAEPPLSDFHETIYPSGLKLVTKRWPPEEEVLKFSSDTTCELLLDKEISTFYSNLTPTG